MLLIRCHSTIQGDWSEVPRSYKCPECGVGVRRFKPLTAQMKAVMQARGQQKKSRGDAGGGWYNREADNNMSGAQRAIADAQRRKDKKGKGKAREELLAKYMNNEKSACAERGARGRRMRSVTALGVSLRLHLARVWYPALL